MNGLVRCYRTGREIQLSAGQCRKNYREAEEWQELGWPLYVRAKCLACQAAACVGRESEAHPATIGAAATKSRPGRVEPAPTKAKCVTRRDTVRQQATPEPKAHRLEACATEPLCRACGAAAWGKSGLCFDHLVAQSLLRVERKRREQRRYVAKKSAALQGTGV